MPSPTREETVLAEDAAEWVARLSFDSSRECREGLVTWLQRSSLHVEKFLLAQATYRLFHYVDPQRKIDVEELIAKAKSSTVPLRHIGTELDQDPQAIHAVAEDPGTEEGVASPLHASRSSPRPIWRRLSLGVAALLVLAVTWRFVDDLDTQTYTTALGEQRTVRLSDGSLIELNTRSKAQVHFSKGVRKVRLLAGEALFVVAHDASRPFRVFTGEATIQAVGTQFSVYVSDTTTTRVAVVEGRIQVAAEGAAAGGSRAPSGSVEPEPAGKNSSPTYLAAGEEASVTHSGVVMETKPNVQNAIAWRQRRIVFHDTSLSEVVKELSRYNEFRIRLVGDELPNRHISGSFKADDPQTIVSLLESDPSVTVEHVNDGVIITLKD